MIWRVMLIEGVIRQSRRLEPGGWHPPRSIYLHIIAEFNNCLIIHSKYLPGKTKRWLKIIEWMILMLLYIIYSKSAKIVCVAVGKFVCDVNGVKTVRSFFVYVQNCRLLNLSWFILERSHVFSLRAVELDLSPAALVAGFTRISLHNVITLSSCQRFIDACLKLRKSCWKSYHAIGRFKLI